MCYCKKLATLQRTLNHHKGLARSFRIARRLLSSRARLYGWGSCDAGELGTYISEATDIPFPLAVDTNVEIDSASCGYGTTFLIKKTKAGAIGLGLNSVGQLGTKKDTNEVTLDGVITKMACGRVHSLAVSNRGVFAAGSNIQGQCGLARDKQFCHKFEQVPVPFDHKLIKQVACGLDHSLILTSEGKVFSTGLGADGQTGTGSYNCQYGFQEVAGEIRDEKITQISTSTDICLALTDNSNVFGWGNNEQGQISWQNKEKQVAIPNYVPDSSNFAKIDQVFAGGSFSAFLTNGNVYVTGYGALGLGKDSIEVYSYRKVDFDPDSGGILMLSGGPDYMAALTDAGKLLTWGRGNHGRLGHGNTEDQFTPKMVSLPGHVLEFACGIDHMVAIVESHSDTAPVINKR